MGEQRHGARTGARSGAREGGSQARRSGSGGQRAAVVRVSAAAVLEIVHVAGLVAKPALDVLFAEVARHRLVVVVGVGERHLLRVPPALGLSVADAAQAVDLLVGPVFERQRLDLGNGPAPGAAARKHFLVHIGTPATEQHAEVPRRPRGVVRATLAAFVDVVFVVDDVNEASFNLLAVFSEHGGVWVEFLRGHAEMSVLWVCRAKAVRRGVQVRNLVLLQSISYTVPWGIPVDLLRWWGCGGVVRLTPSPFSSPILFLGHGPYFSFVGNGGVFVPYCKMFRDS